MADLEARMTRLIQTFPPEVVGRLYGTLAHKVAFTPSGCLPISNTP